MRSPPRPQSHLQMAAATHTTSKPSLHACIYGAQLSSQCLQQCLKFCSREMHQQRGKDVVNATTTCQPASCSNHPMRQLCARKRASSIYVCAVPQTGSSRCDRLCFSAAVLHNNCHNNCHVSFQVCEVVQYNITCRQKRPRDTQSVNKVNMHAHSMAIPEPHVQQQLSKWVLTGWLAGARCNRRQVYLQYTYTVGTNKQTHTHVVGQSTTCTSRQQSSTAYIFVYVFVTCNSRRLTSCMFKTSCSL